MVSCSIARQDCFFLCWNKRVRRKITSKGILTNLQVKFFLESDPSKQASFDSSPPLLCWRAFGTPHSDRVVFVWKAVLAARTVCLCLFHSFQVFKILNNVIQGWWKAGRIARGAIRFYDRHIVGDFRIDYEIGSRAQHAVWSALIVVWPFNLFCVSVLSRRHSIARAKTSLQAVVRRLPMQKHCIKWISGIWNRKKIIPCFLRVLTFRKWNKKFSLDVHFKSNDQQGINQSLPP